MNTDQHRLKRELVELSHIFYERGWSLATSSNFSIRIDDSSMLITASGKDKSLLSEADIVHTTLSGEVIEGRGKPSAETLLHGELYRTNPQIGAVIHTHSLYATLLSTRHLNENFIAIEGYEMLKALSGVTTHEHREIIPIFPNNQDMHVLAGRITPYISEHPECHSVLIAAHGLYCWGRDVAEAKRHVEALEFLFECEYRKAL
ncbi:MAG: methylthioribulose 1-phosphate dehydratase [Acidobacteria bacterium]|nr:MAG: methylthioribulose 1-phosphate dehydratase [Acidobacteriota bacterium]